MCTIGTMPREVDERSRQRVEANRFAGRRVRVKVRRRKGGAPGLADLSPEFDDLAEIARATGRPLRALEHEVLRAARELLGHAASDRPGRPRSRP